MKVSIAHYNALCGTYMVDDQIGVWMISYDDERKIWVASMNCAGKDHMMLYTNEHDAVWYVHNHLKSEEAC